MHKKILIAGWRGISHSFGMVNQYQILALSKVDNIKIGHVDVPYFLPNWNRQDHSSGFSADEQSYIDNLPTFSEEDVDCVYSICSPLRQPNLKAKKTITFAVCELNFDAGKIESAVEGIDNFTAGKNLLVTPSRWARDRILDFGFPEDKVRVVPHGVDLVKFMPAAPDEIAQNRAAIGIKNDDVVFLNVGVPTWNKGLDILIKAFAVVNKMYPSTKLVVKDARKLYGIQVEQVLRDVGLANPGLITEHTLASIFPITENLSQLQMRAVYGLADWYVSPYRAEGFNLPALEAQACGTPVIVSSGGATDDFCGDESGYKVATVFNRRAIGDIKEACWSEARSDALVEIMMQVAKQGPNRTYLQSDVRQRARSNAEKYPWSHAVKKLSEFF